MRETLRLLFGEIERLRNCTSHSEKADEAVISYITRSKLLSAVNGVQCFKHVRSNPPKDYLRLRNSLYDAATQMDTEAIMNTKSRKENPPELSGDIFYTDRSFKGKKTQGRYVKPKTQKRYAGNSNECWVCGKKLCHSTNHSKEERQKRRMQFRNYMHFALESSDEEVSPTDDDKTEESEEEDSYASVFSTVLSSNVFMLRNNLDPSEQAEFLGIALDTCCTKYCTISLVQYQAYCNFTGQAPMIHPTKVGFNTSAGNISSIGYAWVVVPFGNLKPILRVLTHIFDHPSTAPMLLSYDVMKKEGWDMVISNRRLQSSADKSKYVVYDEVHGLPMYRWNMPSNVELRNHSAITSLYTIQELRNIHRRTGHPSAKRLMQILEASPRPLDLPPETKSMLNRISKSCRACQIISKPPERFRFTIHDESRFNHEILVDIFSLSDGNVLHILCAGTKYQLGRFVDTVSARECWETIRMAWIDVLSGAPDFIKSDAGSQFKSKEFKDSAKSLGICVEIVPTDAHFKVGLIERYHKIVRDVYGKLKIDTPDMSRELRLSMTFRCINDTAGFDGIVPTLLVFVSYPRIANNPDEMASDTIIRAKAVRSAAKHASEVLTAERLRRESKSGPAANLERIDTVKRLERNAPVLVYREGKGWSGPMKFIGADDHGAWVQNDKGNETRVSLHVVKPFVPEQWVVPRVHFAKTN